ncbi:FAD-binding domain-containing protein [Halorubrum vacuolatum]|uniref:Deoxyribodipyrimidine photo-lyase n=1 Tax=Halorubrum vacuolatum TaxID=63740 RepID=A0A238UND2_HALVU|nr:FAD-binding domain-containing protein [Halorubrum vacuolatum]SNR23107.1 deoxyribodipyrimidine photo-lyase [Halorubrum vacuolatum]
MTDDTGSWVERIATVDDGCVVWHRRDLRTVDSPALAFAADRYDVVCPVFVFDPRFYGTDGLACDARCRFLHESLADLDRAYTAYDGSLTFLSGSPIDLLSQFSGLGWDIVAGAEPTGRYGLRRDDAAADRLDVRFIADDGLVRDAADTRDGWSETVERWFERDVRRVDPDGFDVTDIDTGVSIAVVEGRYDLTPTKRSVPAGGRRAGLERLHAFIDRLPEYLGNVSSPTDAWEGTSRLSPYLRFGCLSIREVYQTVREDAPSCRGREAFISRLYWNRHYTQKLADWSGWMDTAVNPAMEGFREEERDAALIEAWKRGETGYPMVDASMRCLAETGWLNFRMRAMCASFLCDLLGQPWRIGADWFYYHLIDADPAINYSQFQTQVGMVGVNMRRIYNPRKQVRENDPDGSFVRTWVPELTPLPTRYLERPERTPIHVQESCGIEIGEDYPYPVVAYETARTRAMEAFDAIEPAAKRALADPEVRRRASLSRRGRGRGHSSADIQEPGPDATQTSLSRFEE